MSRPLPSLAARPARLLVTLTLLAAALATTNLPTTGAAATGASPAAAPVRVDLAVTGLTLPVTPGSPDVLVATGVAFTVTATLRTAGGAPAAFSTRQDVNLALSVTAGATSLLAGSTTAVVQAGKSSTSFPGLVLGPANSVQLTVRATAPAKAAQQLAPGRTAPFDVVKDFDSKSFSPGGGLTVSREGLGVACEATPARPTCADLRLPTSAETGGTAFFSTGVCDPAVGCPASRDVLQVLAAFRYERTNPATLIVKCDKSLCGGGGIPSKQLQVSLSPTGPLTTAPPCSSKGVVDVGLTHCVDYVQSKRAGSGDLHLYLLLLRDVRSSCC